MRNVITSVIQDQAQLSELVEYLHAVREEERVALARKIHDELGGLMVSTAMDLGWAESNIPNAALPSRLRRMGVSLAGAIDLNRNIIELLRPSLLDNFGLFEALRWYFRHACRRTEIECTETYPPAEAALSPRALSQLYRAIETLLDCTFKEDNLKAVYLQASMGSEELTIRIGHEHSVHENVDVLERFRNELTSAAHRLAGFRSELSFDLHEKGLEFFVDVPLKHVRPD